jgi:hypothetical protein
MIIATRKRVAVHEAGHIVVYALAGGTIRKAWAQQESGWTIPDARAGFRLPARVQAPFHLAGIAAECVRYGGLVHFLRADMIERWKQIAGDGSEAARIIMETEAGDFNERWSEVFTTTFCLLRSAPVWPIVEKLAALMNLRHEIDWSAIDPLVRPVVGSFDFRWGEAREQAQPSLSLMRSSGWFSADGKPQPSRREPTRSHRWLPFARPTPQIQHPTPAA